MSNLLTDLEQNENFIVQLLIYGKLRAFCFHLRSVMRDILLALEAQFESLSSQSGEDFEDNQIEEAALGAIGEAKISLQMV